ncbi:hypothetical protein ACROYT_G023657 [Oculina patagonica]
MEVSQVVLNGEIFLQNGRPMILAISPGNPHYYKLESLQRLFEFAARNKSDQILLFIPDKIFEHDYRAIGSKNPKMSARGQGNRLRNKCNEAIQSSGLCHANYSFIRWTEDVESCPHYQKALADIQDLYEVNDDFRADIRESTEAALRCLKNGREKGGSNKKTEIAVENAVDLKEGVLYLLKELAFLVAIPSIYENCDEFVFVYHRPWPVLERYFSGGYDDIGKPSLGYVVFE